MAAGRSALPCVKTATRLLSQILALSQTTISKTQRRVMVVGDLPFTSHADTNQSSRTHLVAACVLDRDILGLGRRLCSLFIRTGVRNALRSKRWQQSVDHVLRWNRNKLPHVCVLPCVERSIVEDRFFYAGDKLPSISRPSTFHSLGYDEARVSSGCR